MNPKASCADMACHHPHDMAGIPPNAQREENSNRTTYTMAEPSRDVCTTVQEISLGTGGYRLQKPGQIKLAQSTPAQLMRKAATVRHTQVTSSGKTPWELAMGRKPRDLLDPASMNPEQLTSTPDKHNNWLCKLILVCNNERTSAEILLNG